MTNPETIITPRDMHLGDIVRLHSTNGYYPAYSDCTVKQIKDGFVTLFRPYVHTSSFSYTGGVATYIGIEEYQINRDSDKKYVLLDRAKLK